MPFAIPKMKALLFEQVQWESFNRHPFYRSHNLVFEIFSYTAQKEREKINQRVREGMQKAKIIGTRSGKPIGRPERKDTIPKDFEKYYKRWTNKAITGVEFAKLLGLSRMSLYRYINTYEQINNITRE